MASRPGAEKRLLPIVLIFVKAARDVAQLSRSLHDQSQRGEILEERFARGEIGRKEYWRMCWDIQVE
jgi:uncharacterized membrane protein